MLKTEVYSWRVSPEMKSALEEAARQDHQKLSTLLERIVKDWLKEYRAGRGDDDREEQKLLHKGAARALGKIRGGDPHRSERARHALRARIAKRRAG